MLALGLSADQGERIFGAGYILIGANQRESIPLEGRTSVSGRDQSQPAILAERWAPERPIATSELRVIPLRCARLVADVAGGAGPSSTCDQVVEAVRAPMEILNKSLGAP